VNKSGLGVKASRKFAALKTEGETMRICMSEARKRIYNFICRQQQHTHMNRSAKKYCSIRSIVGSPGVSAK